MANQWTNDDNHLLNQHERTIWRARFFLPYTSKCGRSLNPSQSLPQYTRASATFLSRANLLSSKSGHNTPLFIVIPKQKCPVSCPSGK